MAMNSFKRNRKSLTFHHSMIREALKDDPNRRKLLRFNGGYNAESDRESVRERERERTGYSWFSFIDIYINIYLYLDNIMMSHNE